MSVLVASLQQAARYQSGEMVPPAAVLWNDPDEEWKPLLPLMLERLPQLLVYGPYNLSRRTGPAIWLKCVLAGTLEELHLPAGVVPVVYLPGVSRQTLRAGGDCPKLLQPLVELQYRGAVWSQRNGRDWTVEAFLLAELGLDLARDERTRQSMLGTLAVLAETPLSLLSDRRLEADDFDRLLVSDPARDLLVWMSDPGRAQHDWKEEKWKAFLSSCREIYKFDPVTDGETVAGEMLGGRKEAAWRLVWERFCEAPSLYSGIASLLSRSKPTGRLIFDYEDSWPEINDAHEKQLRSELLELENVSPVEARRRLGEVERKHSRRRQWVWAKLGKSSLALSLEYLALLADHTESSLGGETTNEMARLYADGAYLADDVVLTALALVRAAEDVRAVQAAVRATYLPWAESAAQHFQSLLAKQPLPSRGAQPGIEMQPGQCLLFADGLRFDLAQRLAGNLEARGLKVQQERRWAALPTVTPTAKPAVSPIADFLIGTQLPDNFLPQVAATGQQLTTDRFRKLLADRGYSYLASDEVGHAGEPDARGWTEFGQIDARGHDLKLDLARTVAGEIDRLGDRIAELLDAGWLTVNVVTDHGWLLMPGGLPKHDLPAYLVESRWARCASIKGDSKVKVPKASWHWNPSLEFATAPGISCFQVGHVYAHGGLSLQECLIAQLEVTSIANVDTMRSTIKELHWLNLRCRILVEPADGRLRIDLRTRANDPASSLIASPKSPDGDGKLSLVIENEDLIGTAAILVILDSAGQVITKRSTLVGGEQQ